MLTIAIWYLTAGCYIQTDWTSFMSRQDMTWTRLPQTWYEAPFMGNGSMGSYICKEPGKNAIRVDVGNSMVHDQDIGTLGSDTGSQLYLSSGGTDTPGGFSVP